MEESLPAHSNKIELAKASRFCLCAGAKRGKDCGEWGAKTETSAHWNGAKEFVDPTCKTKQAR